MPKSTPYLYLSQLAIIASLPFHFLMSSYAIILAVLAFLFYVITSTSFRQHVWEAVKKNSTAQFLLLYYALTIVSLGIHFSDYEDISLGLTSLEQKLGFLIFPFLMASISHYSKRQWAGFFKVFIISIFISSIIALVSGLFYTLNSGSLYYFDEGTGVIFNNFMYHRLGSYVGMHAVYYAEYVLLAFIIWVSFSYYHFKQWNTIKRLLALLTGAYFISFIVLLKSATILLVLLVIVGLFTLYYLYKAKEKLSTTTKTIVLFTALVLVALLGTRAISKIGSKASYFTYDYAQPGGGQWNGINLRLAKWSVAKQAIADHWLWGVGPGNTAAVLDTYYKKVGFNYALQLHYNPHNQLLHSFLSLGILGAVVLLLIFGMLLYHGIRKKDSVMVLFSISFFMFSMSESTLAVNKGIIFFTLLVSIFSYLPKKSSSCWDGTPD